MPSLGDPDGVQVLGDAAFKLWNPEGRRLGIRIGTYLPRKWEGEASKAHVVVIGPRDKEILDDRVAVKHIHGHGGLPTHILDFGEGVATVHVSDAERWFAYTYPATPLVLVGEGTEQGHAFHLTVGTTRQWYFYVPEGTERFEVRAECEAETDAVKMRVRAPDRTLDMIYGNAGRRTIEVPPGLDGKIWHVRMGVGSATRMITRKRKGGRYLDINLTLTLRGVPSYLAPSWEQWFNPTDPEMPHVGRAGGETNKSGE